MRLVGVGYRRALRPWIATSPSEVEMLEITAEHFFDHPQLLVGIRRQYPLVVHGLSLSLGTPGPLDPATFSLFKKVVAAANPAWISEHVAFSRTREVDLGHLNPVPWTARSLATLVDHARQVMDECGTHLILENIASHLDLPSEFEETDFLNELCVRSGCGLLLDVTNLFINAKNRSYDPLAWVERLDPKTIAQLHVVGYTQTDESYEDHHAEAIQEDLMEFTLNALQIAKDVQGIIIERDAHFPCPQSLGAELWRLKHGL